MVLEIWQLLISGLLCVLLGFIGGSWFGSAKHWRG